MRKPANVSFEEAAAVPIAAITALQALRDQGGVQPGQKVLINGASGGVGTFAVQIAKALGADVTAVCSTRNVDLARALGADRVVDYSQEDFTRRERAPRADDRHRREQAVQEVQARVDTRGDDRGRRAKFPSNKGIGPLGHVIGTRLGALGRSQTAKFFVAKINKDDLEFLRELLETGQVKPVIDKRFDLSEAADALRYLGEGHARGKVIITM